MNEHPFPRAPRREPPDREKDFPRYDDIRHIDSNAIEYPTSQPADYTMQYLSNAAAPSHPAKNAKKQK